MDGDSGGIQSIARAFRLIEAIAEHDGAMGLSQMALATELPVATTHRFARTLVALGYLRQEPSRQYSLGPLLIRLGESASKRLSGWARPHLAALAERVGESANLALLDSDRVVYVAQAQSRQSMRMFTEVGRRVLPHAAAVGKALLASMPREQAVALLRRTGTPRYTRHTLTTIGDLCRALDRIQERGYAIDDGEQEAGVRCVAIVVPPEPGRLAISVSGPASRMTDEVVARCAWALSATASAVASDLAR